MDLADYLRTLLLITNGITREGVIGISLDRIPEEVRSGFSREQLETANEIVLQLYRDVRYSVNQRFDLELALSRLANLRKYLSPEELVKRIDALQHELIHSAAHHVRQDDSIGREVAGKEPAPGLSASENPLVTDSAAEYRAAKDDVAAEGAAAEDTAAGDTGKPTVLTDITEEHVRTIISRFKTQRIRVASLLSGASSWLLGDDRLVIGFKDNFAAHSLENDRDAIRDEARAVLGLEALRLDMVVEGQNPMVQESPPVTEHVEMVRRVFRGEIVEGEQ